MIVVLLLLGSPGAVVRFSGIEVDPIVAVAVYGVSFLYFGIALGIIAVDWIRVRLLFRDDSSDLEASQ